MCAIARSFSQSDGEPPTITRDLPPPYEGVGSETANWTHDPTAFLQFTRAGDTCYVIAMSRGSQLSGSYILRYLRSHIAKGLRIEVVGAACDVIGFYEKMVERGIIDEFTVQDVEAFFELDEENDFEDNDY
jgi:hypothetical protein